MELPEFPYNTVQDRSKEALVPKTSPVRISAISIELQLVTDTGRSKYPCYHCVTQCQLFMVLLSWQSYMYCKSLCGSFTD